MSLPEGILSRANSPLASVVERSSDGLPRAAFVVARAQTAAVTAAPNKTSLPTANTAQSFEKAHQDLETLLGLIYKSETPTPKQRETLKQILTIQKNVLANLSGGKAYAGFVGIETTWSHVNYGTQQALKTINTSNNPQVFKKAIEQALSNRNKLDDFYDAPLLAKASSKPQITSLDQVPQALKSLEGVTYPTLKQLELVKDILRVQSPLINTIAGGKIEKPGFLHTMPAHSNYATVAILKTLPRRSNFRDYLSQVQANQAHIAKHEETQNQKIALEKRNLHASTLGFYPVHQNIQARVSHTLEQVGFQVALRDASNLFTVYTRENQALGRRRNSSNIDTTINLKLTLEGTLEAVKQPLLKAQPLIHKTVEQLNTESAKYPKDSLEAKRFEGARDTLLTAQKQVTEWLERASKNINTQPRTETEIIAAKNQLYCAVKAMETIEKALVYASTLLEPVSQSPANIASITMGSYEGNPLALTNKTISCDVVALETLLTNIEPTDLSFRANRDTIIGINRSLQTLIKNQIKFAKDVKESKLEYPIDINSLEKSLSNLQMYERLLMKKEYPIGLAHFVQALGQTLKETKENQVLLERAIST